MLPDLKPRLEFALRIAGEASKFIMSHYQTSGLVVERKKDSSPVTAADRGAEELIRAGIGQEFPEDAILGEELGVKEGTSGYRWILDPVDGTKSFIHGVPLFGTLIGVEYQGRCVIGVCRFPALNEQVYAAIGHGCWWQQGDHPPVRAKVSEVSDMKEALFCITTISGWERIGRMDAFEKLRKEVQLTRGWGDCYGHALVATGRADVMVDPLMNPWDIAALVPIVEEAGGAFIDWMGKVDINAGNGCSVNAALKGQLLEILKKP